MTTSPREDQPNDPNSRAIREAQLRFSDATDFAAAARDEDALVSAFQTYLTETRDNPAHQENYSFVFEANK